MYLIFFPFWSHFVNATSCKDNDNSKSPVKTRKFCSAYLHFLNIKCHLWYEFLISILSYLVYFSFLVHTFLTQVGSREPKIFPAHENFSIESLRLNEGQRKFFDGCLVKPLNGCCCIFPNVYPQLFFKLSSQLFHKLLPPLLYKLFQAGKKKQKHKTKPQNNPPPKPNQQAYPIQKHYLKNYKSLLYL